MFLYSPLTGETGDSSGRNQHEDRVAVRETPEGCFSAGKGLDGASSYDLLPKRARRTRLNPTQDFSLENPRQTPPRRNTSTSPKRSTSIPPEKAPGHRRKTMRTQDSIENDNAAACG